MIAKFDAFQEKMSGARHSSPERHIKETKKSTFEDYFDPIWLREVARKTEKKQKVKPARAAVVHGDTTSEVVAASSDFDWPENELRTMLSSRVAGEFSSETSSGSSLESRQSRQRRAANSAEFEERSTWNDEVSKKRGSKKRQRSQSSCESTRPQECEDVDSHTGTFSFAIDEFERFKKDVTPFRQSGEGDISGSKEVVSNTSISNSSPTSKSRT